MMNLRDNKETLYGTKEGEASSSSRQWSLGHKNPRIVRVSRAFGGKDRHSKVCTIKGLRDRRIRLSVPTAIQVYDLQDRLGLGQPSKVIDWLLDITKLDIDKLPPLPPIPSSFPPFQHTVYDSQGHGMFPQSPSDPFRDMNLVSSRSDGVDINRSLNSLDVNEDPLFVGGSKYWDSKQRRIGDDQVFAQNLLPIASGNSSVTPANPSTLMSYSNYPMYNYYHSREPSNVLSLTQMSSLGLSSHNNNHQGNSSRSSSSGSSRMFLSPSMANASLNSQHAAYTHHQVEDHDIQHFNHFKMSNENPFPSSPYTSTSLGLKPFPLYQDNKNDDSPWKSSRNS